MTQTVYSKGAPLFAQFTTQIYENTVFQIFQGQMTMQCHKINDEFLANSNFLAYPRMTVELGMRKRAAHTKNDVLKACD